MSVSESVFAFQEEISTESEIREPEPYHFETLDEPDGELVQFNERFRTYQIGEGQYTTIIGGYSGLFLNEDGETEAVDNTLNVSEETVKIPEPARASASTLRRMAARRRGSQYRNEAGSAKINFPEQINREHGILLTDGEYRFHPAEIL